MALALNQLIRGRRLFLTLVVLLGALIMVRLGFWQLQRRTERLERNALIARRLEEPPLSIAGPIADPAALEYRRMTVAGTFDYAHEVVLRNRSRDGAPGVHVLTPLLIAGSDRAVLVDRGWIPYEQRESVPRRQFQRPGPVEIGGIARASQSRSGRFSPADPPFSPDLPRIDAWFRVDVARIQQQTPYSLLPFYIEQSPETGETGPPWRDNNLELSEGPHLSYAIQWFAFATILVAGYIARATRIEQPSLHTSEAHTQHPYIK